MGSLQVQANVNQVDLEKQSRFEIAQLKPNPHVPPDASRTQDSAAITLHQESLVPPTLIVTGSLTATHTLTQFLPLCLAPTVHPAGC